MKYLAYLILLCSINTLFAQNDAKAEQFLNDVSSKMKTYKNISLNFTYELNNEKENIKQQTRGDVVISGDKYKLNILGVTRIFDGKTLYSISPEDEEITISSDNSEDESSITPSKMLTFYQEGYRYKMDIIQNIKGRKIQYVKLIPIDSNSEIKNVLLGIDKNSKHIYNLIELGKNGTKTVLTVTSFKSNQELSSSMFKLNKKKYEDEGYYINELD